MRIVVDREASRGEGDSNGSGVLDIPKEESAFIKALGEWPRSPTPPESVDIFCDGSCAAPRGPGGFGMYGTDSNGMTYNMWGYVGDNVTCNRAELFAYIRLIESAIYFGWKHINGYFDSRYVIDGATDGLRKWPHNEWKNINGDEISNPNEWKRILELHKELAGRGQTISYIKVKSHSGNDGNNRADVNAKRGKLSGTAGNKEPVIEIEPTAIFAEREHIYANAGHGEEPSEVVASAPSKIKAVKPPACNRLIAGSRLVFRTNSRIMPQAGEHYAYYTAIFDDTTKDEGKNLGNLSSDSLYSVILMKEPVAPLESIIEYQDSITPDDFQQPVVGLLNRIQRPANWEMLSTYGKQHLTHRKLCVCTLAEESLTIYVRPPRNGYEALEILNVLHDRLDFYLSKDDHGYVECIDITDTFYKRNKNKWDMADDYTQESRSFNVNITHKNIPVELTLTIGVDLPPRNNLIGLAKQAKNLKVILFKYELMNAGFRYSVIIEADDNYAIYVTPRANFKAITQA